MKIAQALGRPRDEASARERLSVVALATWAVAATLCAATSRAQSVQLVGAELQVNVFTQNGQGWPAVASEDNGDFVVVWQSEDGQDGSGKGVFARRFASSGSAVGAELQINVYTTNQQWAPSVAMDADGDFVVVWHSAQGQDGSGYGVFGRLYASAGSAIGGEFQINSVTLGTQSYPTVGMDATGRFLVVWQSDTQDGDQFGIRGRRYDAAGTPQASELQVNGTTQNNQILPAAEVNDTGAMAVVWQSNAQDGDKYGIFVTLFSSSGASLSSDIQVNVYTTDDQRLGTVGIAADGSFVVAWRGLAQEGDSAGVFARRFSSTGAGGPELQVNTYTVSEQGDPSIAVNGDGSFVVAWSSLGQDQSGYGVFARRFNRAGASAGPEVQINAFTSQAQQRPAIVASNGGALAVTWESDGQDGSGTGVFARGARSLADLDVDGNGALQPLTDGLLVLRALFGFTGATLTSAVVGAGCTRCDAAAILPYIADLGQIIDIDGDGQTEALTDGLLVLRHLFGFTGATLVTGAFDAQNCSRCDAASIAGYLAVLAN